MANLFFTFRKKSIKPVKTNCLKTSFDSNNSKFILEKGFAKTNFLQAFIYLPRQPKMFPGYTGKTIFRERTCMHCLTSLTTTSLLFDNPKQPPY